MLFLNKFKLSHRGARQESRPAQHLFRVTLKTPDDQQMASASVCLIH